MKLRYNSDSEITEFIDSEDALYHFTRKDVAIENILNDNILKLGTFTKSNDPQEYRRRMTSASGWGWEDSHATQIALIANSIDNIIKSSGFLSFCQNRYKDGELLEHGCLKSRMWSQYGGSHSGVCLVFSKKLLLKQIEQKFAKKLTIYTDTINYKDPYISRAKDSLNINADELSENNNISIAHSYVEEKYEDIFFQKQEDYKDENEFRVIAIDKNGGNASNEFISITTCLKAIILGDSFSKAYEPTIKELSKKLNVPFRKLHWEKNVYILLKWGD